MDSVVFFKILDSVVFFSKFWTLSFFSLVPRVGVLLYIVILTCLPPIQIDLTGFFFSKLRRYSGHSCRQVFITSRLTIAKVDLVIFFIFSSYRHHGRPPSLGRPQPTLPSAQFYRPLPKWTPLPITSVTATANSRLGLASHLPTTDRLG